MSIISSSVVADGTAVHPQDGTDDDVRVGISQDMVVVVTWLFSILFAETTLRLGNLSPAA